MKFKLIVLILCSMILCCACGQSAQNLKSYKVEMSQTDDVKEHEQIMNEVTTEFADVDASKVSDLELRAFLNNCRDGIYVEGE